MWQTKGKRKGAKGQGCKPLTRYKKMTREERIEAMKNPKYAERKGFAVDKRISLREVFVITNLTPEEYQWLCDAVEWILSDILNP